MEYRENTRVFGNIVDFSCDMELREVWDGAS